MKNVIIGFYILSLILSGCRSPLENWTSQSSEPSGYKNYSLIKENPEFSEVAAKKATPESLISVFYFDCNESSLDDVSKKLLSTVAIYLKSNPSQKIVIVGNTDILGPHQYNQALGQQRANSVSIYLISQGVPPQQMSVVSRGKENPLSLVDSDQAQALNRRVEILFEYL